MASVGQKGVVHQGVLDSLRPVGQHGEGGDLRAGTRRGGHRHKADVRPGPQLLAELQHGLGAVHGRAAAEGHHRLGAELRQRPGPLGHQLQGRVGHHLVEHLHGAVPQAGGVPAPAGPDWARKESVITITRRPASPSRAARGCPVQRKLWA